MIAASDFTLFLGRFHPLLVHLPVGLIVLLVFLELLGRSPRFAGARSVIGPVLLLAVPTAVAAAACGWLLSRGGGYDAQLLRLHFWTGLAVAALCILLGLVHWFDLKRLYRPGLVLSFISLVGASHFGGSLTHGKDYLARYAPWPLRALLGGGLTNPIATPPEVPEMHAYAHVVKPVFDKYCVSCHGPEKAKVGLRLDSLNALLKGGDNGVVLVAGKAAESRLVEFMSQPLDGDDHMPPDGKPQPTPDELALIRWWVDAGASDKKVGELTPPAYILRALENRFASAPTSPRPPGPKPLAEVLPIAESLADELGISITALYPGEPWLQCNASLAGGRYGDADLARLAPLCANLRWLDLAGTAVTDLGVGSVARMPHLVRLYLERTAVTDNGLAHLTGLADLEYLNLYGTAISDTSLETLKSFPKLRQVYLWQTHVTPEAAKAFAESRLDRNQLAAWEDEIRRLQAQIEKQGVSVQLGAPASAASGPVPINTVCPVSSKLADRTLTMWHEGKLVAFCCDDCKAAFAKDPEPHLARLGQFAKDPPGALGLKPINEKCPVSGEGADLTQTTVYGGKVIAFCCAKCKATFDRDPKPHLAKLDLKSATPATGARP